MARLRLGLRRRRATLERFQLAASSKAYASGGVLVPSEHHIGAFHTWVTDHLVPTHGRT